MIKTVIGMYPTRPDAERARSDLERMEIDEEEVLLLTQADIKQVDRLLSAISKPKSSARNGLLVGLVIGAILGLWGGATLLAGPNSTIPAYVFGLMGMVPSAILGGYIGSLFGARDASVNNIRIKQNLANENAVLLVAQTNRQNEEGILTSLRASDGEFVEAHNLEPDWFEKAGRGASK